MATTGFSGGALPTMVSAADFVEYHVREAESRWEGEAYVALSAQIIIVQLIESAVIDLFNFANLDREFSRETVLAQIDTQFPKFLDLVRMRARDREGQAGIQTDLYRITPLLILGHLPQWLERHCGCYPQ